MKPTFTHNILIGGAIQKTANGKYKNGKPFYGNFHMFSNIAKMMFADLSEPFYIKYEHATKRLLISRTERKADGFVRRLILNSKNDPDSSSNDTFCIRTGGLPRYYEKQTDPHGHLLDAVFLDWSVNNIPDKYSDTSWQP